MNKPNNVVLLCLHGSHLYGTDTPESDKDYKGIYQATPSEIILDKAQETIIFNTKPTSDRRRNTKDDVDYQYKELRRFIKDALAGQIYAIDLLFSPPSYWLDHNDIWDDIREHRQKLLSSNVKPFIGYVKQQAAKYGLKSGRLAEVVRFRDWLGTNFNSMPVGQVFDQFEQSEYIRLVELEDKSGNSVPYIKVLEKHYQLNQKCGGLGYALSQWINKYGARSVEAMENKGVDFKAVSHAFRCIFQVKELLSYGHVTMPLHNRQFLKEVKQGKHSYLELQTQLEELMDGLDNIESVLPPEPDYTFWQERLVSYYLG